MLFFILGCAQTSTVLYKPDAVYSSTDNLEVYDDKTNIPYEYFVIGQVSSRIEGTGQQQHLMEKMKEKAMAQGAEGLIDIEVSTALKLYALVTSPSKIYPISKSPFFSILSQVIFLHFFDHSFIYF